MTMKITGLERQIAKIHTCRDFRIDFGLIGALIGLPQPRFPSTMSADPPKTPVPLAEISQGPNAFEMFLDRNQKNLIILAILLVLATAALVVYRGIEQGRQQSAGAALSKAADLAELQAVVGEHGDTQAAYSAMILLAAKQWQEGQQDNALETLRKFIDANPKHPALPTARAGLASKLMAQGKTAEAAEIFQSLIDDPSARFVAPFALIALGDMAYVANDTERAEILYNRVKTDFADSNFVDRATRRITNLKAKAPVEIDPPPAPELDPTTGDAPGFNIAPVPDFGTPGNPPLPPDGVVPVPADPAPTPGDAAPAPDATPPAEETPPAEPAGVEPEGGTAPAADEPAQETAPETRNNPPTEEIQGAEPQQEDAQDPGANPQQDPETESNL
jgi:predicted negative regulator of RcsB-dependent stress response